MARARDIPDLAPALSFRIAAANAVEARSLEVFEHAEGVLDTDDIERVHDMRVATRRLRAVMEIFAPCFPRREFKRTLRDVERLADALGERRDPDVQIAALEQIAGELTAEDRPGVQSLIDDLRERQLAGNRALSEALERIQREALQARLTTLSEEARNA